MEIGMFNLWSHPGNTELNQIAKLPFLFATISADWALTNAVLLLKGPNSSAAGAQWCLCVFLLLMNNKDWPPHFPLAPSHCTLHHDWGSGGPLSNVDISQQMLCQWNTGWSKVLKSPSLLPGLQKAVLSRHCSCTKVWPHFGLCTVLSTGVLELCSWVGWTGPAQQGAPAFMELWNTHTILENSKSDQKDFSAAKAPPCQCLHLTFCDQCWFWKQLNWFDLDHFTLQVHPSQQQQEDPHGITGQGLLVQPSSALKSLNSSMNKNSSVWTSKNQNGVGIYFNQEVVSEM